jgi:hypothetical protein
LLSIQVKTNKTKNKFHFLHWKFVSQMSFMCHRFCIVLQLFVSFWKRWMALKTIFSFKWSQHHEHATLPRPLLQMWSTWLKRSKEAEIHQPLLSQISYWKMPVKNFHSRVLSLANLSHIYQTRKMSKIVNHWYFWLL